MTKQIPLTRGMFALVDDEDFERISQFKWCAHKIGWKWYATSSLKKPKQLIYMHRVITSAPDKMVIDHINGNGLDNRKSNLRFATRGENLLNRGKQANNTTGFKGVIWDKSRGKYQARIMLHRKTIHLGRYADITEAARAYDRAAKRLFGEFANLNFPDE